MSDVTLFLEYTYHYFFMLILIPSAVNKCIKTALKLYFEKSIIPLDLRALFGSQNKKVSQSSILEGGRRTTQKMFSLFTC